MRIFLLLFFALLIQPALAAPPPGCSKSGGEIVFVVATLDDGRTQARFCVYNDAGDVLNDALVMVASDWAALSPAEKVAEAQNRFAKFVIVSHTEAPAP